MTVTLYHNPACSNSRACLAILEESGAAFRIVEYLTTPLTPRELAELAQRLKATAGAAWTVRDMMRTREPAYAGLELAGDDALLAALAAHPILLNRPIVTTPTAAKLCRPPEVVREMI